MKYDCDKRIRRKCERWLKWFEDILSGEYRVFAFLPKRVGPNDCRWFEYVNRKSSLIYSALDSEYLNNAKREFKTGDYKGCLLWLHRIGSELFYLKHTYTPTSKEA